MGLVEVEQALKKKDAGLLRFEAPQVVARFDKNGDLFEPVLELKQKLPDLKAGAVSAAQPEPITIAAQADEDTPQPREASKKNAEERKKKTAPKKISAPQRASRKNARRV